MLGKGDEWIIVQFSVDRPKLTFKQLRIEYSFNSVVSANALHRILRKPNLQGTYSV